MADKTAGCGYHDIGTHGKAAFFLFKADAVIASVDGGAGYVGEVGESFYLLVNLLGQLTGGDHDKAIDRAFRVLSG